MKNGFVGKVKENAKNGCCSRKENLMKLKLSFIGTKKNKFNR